MTGILKVKKVKGFMNTIRVRLAGHGCCKIRWFAVCLLVLTIFTSRSVTVLAQDEDEPYGPRPSALDASRERDAVAKQKYAGNKDVLVLPGLVANRETRDVTIFAESTGLAGGTELEFLLVGINSSHGYEALLWSYAKPSDVHKALEFIGLRAGSPFNPAALRFWADGDPVIMSIAEEGGIPERIEQLVFDNETEMTLPEEGFIFTGSLMVPSPDGSGKQVYAADVYDPYSVASIYNEQTAVLDVPRLANKGELYGRQVVNPDTALEGGTLLEILLEPGEETRRAPPPRYDLTLLPSDSATGMVYRLSGQTDEHPLATSSELVPILEHLSNTREQDIAPYLALHIDEKLALGDAVKPCVSLAMMESLGMVRMDPPKDGQLYYRAFVPQKMWMQPEGRPTQPWELHLSKTQAQIRAKMIFNEHKPSDDPSQLSFDRHVVELADGADLASKLAADAKNREDRGKMPLPGVLLVFVSPDVRYGQLMAFLRPVQDTHGTVYVFVVE